MPALVDEPEHVERFAFDLIVKQQWEGSAATARKTMRPDMIAASPLHHRAHCGLHAFGELRAQSGRNLRIRADSLSRSSRKRLLKTSFTPARRKPARNSAPDPPRSAGASVAASNPAGFPHRCADRVPRSRGVVGPASHVRREAAPELLRPDIRSEATCLHLARRLRVGKPGAAASLDRQGS